jgi:non-lysosomal glucosylceramidase
VYFNYDQGSTCHTDIMAEQLAGQWYANLTGLGDLVPPQMRKSALQRGFNCNVMKFQGGEIRCVRHVPRRHV